MLLGKQIPGGPLSSVNRVKQYPYPPINFWVAHIRTRFKRVRWFHFACQTHHNSFSATWKLSFAFTGITQYGTNALNTRMALHDLVWLGLSLINLNDRTQQVVVDGESSATAPVTSGVPQGSVIRPILFMIYINDLPTSVKSKVRLFADDTIIYRHINKHQDTVDLQDDLRQLEDWESKWQMEFHPGKCQVVHFTRSSKPIKTTYILHNQHLDAVASAKYLGITLASDLSWKPHIAATTAKANRSLGFLKRNLQVSSPPIKEKAYISLVRPQLEYATTVWDPYHQNQVRPIEMVQRRAARWPGTE